MWLYGIYQIIFTISSLSPSPLWCGIELIYIYWAKEKVQTFFFKNFGTACSHAHSCGAKNIYMYIQISIIQHEGCHAELLCVQHWFFWQYDQGIRRSDSMFLCIVEFYIFCLKGHEIFMCNHNDTIWFRCYWYSLSNWCC